jgi:tetratricopeptide (TPR) repeat protein
MARKALQIDGTLGPGHVASAHVKAAYQWEWGDAEKELLQGLDLSPTDANGHFVYAFGCLLPQGRLEEAESEIRKALELNPSSSPISADLGWIIYCQRHFDLALEQLNQSSRLDPLFYRSYMYTGCAYEQQSNLEKALSAFVKAEELSEREPAASGAMGRCLGLMGNNKDAMEVLNALCKRSKRAYVSPIDFANVHIGLGEIDLAVEWLEKGVADQCARLTHLNVDPAYDQLKSNPRYIDLLKKMRLDYIRSGTDNPWQFPSGA